MNARGAGEETEHHELRAGAEAVGRFHAWWRGDPLPGLVHLPGLSIEPGDDVEAIGDLAGLEAREIQDRMRHGHQPWLARMAGEPVAWGWCAAAEASIGELGITRPIPPGNRYLWDFMTLPPWRGRGIYPRMLQTIVTREAQVERFWLGHDLGNTASARGIAKAGFDQVGLLLRRRDGGFTLRPSGPLPRAAAAAALFGVSIVGHEPAQTA